MLIWKGNKTWLCRSLGLRKKVTEKWRVIRSRSFCPTRFGLPATRDAHSGCQDHSYSAAFFSPTFGMFGNATQTGWYVPFKVKYGESPIADTYREGKLKRTFGERVQDTMKPLKDKRVGPPQRSWGTPSVASHWGTIVADDCASSSCSFCVWSSDANKKEKNMFPSRPQLSDWNWFNNSNIIILSFFLQLKYLRTSENFCLYWNPFG